MTCKHEGRVIVLLPADPVHPTQVDVDAAWAYARDEAAAAGGELCGNPLMGIREGVVNGIDIFTQNLQAMVFTMHCESHHG